VTFSIWRGELFANGAGKTSTMELLAGLVPAALGSVQVFGCDPGRERGRVRYRMGIMLQEGGFPPDLTVAETGRPELLLMEEPATGLGHQGLAAPEQGIAVPRHR
jgi:ABC-2 type transport system ATP-binding protein